MKKKNNKVDKVLKKALEGAKEQILKEAPGHLKKIKRVILSKHTQSKINEDKELEKWANQRIVITCTMEEAGDLMDLLFMADASPFNNAFRDTIKLNRMEKAYSHWLNKMVDTVCPEIAQSKKKKIRNGSTKLLKSYEHENKKRKNN